MNLSSIAVDPSARELLSRAYMAALSEDEMHAAFQQASLDRVVTHAFLAAARSVRRASGSVNAKGELPSGGAFAEALAE